MISSSNNIGELLFPKIRKQQNINTIESDADYRAIRRGYGKNLISLVKFERSKKIKYKNEYFSIAKIKRIMKNNY